MPSEKPAVFREDPAGLLLQGKEVGEPDQGALRAVVIELGGQFREPVGLGLDLGAQTDARRAGNPAQVLAAEFREHVLQGPRQGGLVQGQAGCELVAQAPDHRAEQGSFAAELAVDGAQRDMRLPGQGFQAHVTVPMLGKQLDGSIEELIPPEGLFALAGTARSDGCFHGVNKNWQIMKRYIIVLFPYHLGNLFGRSHRAARHPRRPQPLTGHPDPRQFIRRQVDAHLPKILLALFLLGLLGCESSAQKAPVAPPPMPVKIAQPIYQEVVQWDEYPARIEAVESVDVRARVDGYLEKVNFKAGDKVKKGDLLFVIDPRPFRAQLSFAEASLEQARSASP